MSAYHSHEPYFRIRGGAGYSVKAYQIGGTTTPISTYADRDKGATNPWPVILDADGADGIALIYLDQSATLDVLNLDDESTDGYPATWVFPAQQVDLLALAARVTTAENDIDALQVTAADHAEQLEDHETRIDAAEATIVDHETRIDAAEATLTNHESRLDAAEATLTNHESRLDAAEPVIVAHEDRLDADDLLLAAIDDWIETASDAIVDHESRIGIAETTITDHGSRIDIAEDALDTIDAWSETVDAALASADTRLDDLEANATQSAAGKFYDPNTRFLHQWGTVNTAGNGDGVVTFGTAYAAAPVVTTSPVWAEWVTVTSPGTPSTTGFTASCRRTNDEGTPQAITVLWHAVGFAPEP